MDVLFQPRAHPQAYRLAESYWYGLWFSWGSDSDIFLLDVVGFYFLNLASSYTPASDLAAFLAAGPPPIYIG